MRRWSLRESRSERVRDLAGDHLAPPAFRVEVPATSANLGPGFDALGMALGLTNVVHVEASARATVQIEGEGIGELSTGTDNLVYRPSRG